MRSSLLASVDVREFQTIEAYSNLDLTNVKYSTYKLSREEYLKVIERIRPNNFMHSENTKSTTKIIIIIIIIHQYTRKTDFGPKRSPLPRPYNSHRRYKGAVAAKCCVVRKLSLNGCFQNFTALLPSLPTDVMHATDPNITKVVFLLNP
jgi:hypothetical protein